jgi:hypothetical protein
MTTRKKKQGVVSIQLRGGISSVPLRGTEGLPPVTEWLRAFLECS